MLGPDEEEPEEFESYEEEFYDIDHDDWPYSSSDDSYRYSDYGDYDYTYADPIDDYDQ